MSNVELDSPPPRSQFRRPWSPDELIQAGPDDGRWRNVHMRDEEHQQQQRQQRREASDVSVEALDLADYARTLRTRHPEGPYPAFPSPRARYPPPPPPSSFPSLGSTATLSSSAPSYARRAARRPYSLPPTPKDASSSQGSSSRAARYAPCAVVDPDVPEEIDISHFPKWSRAWYSTNNPHRPSRFVPPPELNNDVVDDIYTPVPRSHFNSKKKTISPFDPGYVHDPYDTSPPPFLSSIGHESSRDVLPWSMDPPEYGAPLDPTLKEERMRMLEREFGSQGGGGGNNKRRKGRDSGLVLDANGDPVVGTVDERGNLVTSGPKRRVLLRVLQIVLAAGACVPAIYATIAIKPLDPKDPPPSANKPPVFVLYVLSSLTLLLLFYLFLVRPCCCRSRKKSNSASPGNPLMTNGMMVLPVAAAPGTGGSGKKSWKGGGGGGGSNKGKHGVPGRDVQVNLIVDPNAFRPPDSDDDDDDDDEDNADGFEDDASDEGGSGMMVPGGYHDRRRKKKRRRRRTRRKGVMEGLRMEAEWKAARSRAKKMTAVDVGGFVCWAAAFVLVLIGQRCPSGAYLGWCDAYNLSAASACLLAVAFAVSLFFDVQDLYASKLSPRTRS